MKTSRMLVGCFLLSVALSSVQEIGLAQEANPTVNPRHPTQVPNNGEPVSQSDDNVPLYRVRVVERNLDA